MRVLAGRSVSLTYPKSYGILTKAESNAACVRQMLEKSDGMHMSSDAILYTSPSSEVAPSKVGEGDQHVAHRLVILVVGVQAHGTVAGEEQRGVVLGATKSVDHGVEQTVDHGVASGLRARSHQRALRVGSKENAFVILRLADAG